MQLTVALAILEGIAHDVLDDPERMSACLSLAVQAGGFTLHELCTVKFSPQGVTAAAIVGESHLTLHSWPEEGRLFVDIASCGAPEGVDRAFDAIVRQLVGARVVELQRLTLR